jgi:hypothetical protein
MINILLCVPVRQKEEIFKLHIESLNRLNIPENINLSRLFVLHNCESLDKYLYKDDFKLIFNTDEEFNNNNNHKDKWKEYNIQMIANIKNNIISTVKNSYDYIFWVDSDLILHKDTLKYLIQANKDIVSEIYWTDWQNSGVQEPNAWELDEYSFYKDTFQKYRKEGLYKCGGTGACILVKSDVYRDGVNYSSIYNISFWGEDRAFSVRAACAGYELYVDTHTPCYHLYNDEYLQNYIKK